MPKTPCRFTETEIARAIRAADRVGLRVTTINIDRDGQVRLNVEKQIEEPASPEATS